MPTDTSFIAVTRENVNLIQRFLSTAGSSLASFRYFKNRDLSVIDNHICTYILLRSSEPVGYGHLDREGDIIWLGIAVSESAQGKGYGNKILSKLLDTAASLGLKSIRLSVDAQNLKAIALYQKYGFYLIEQRGEICFFNKEIPYEYTPLHT